MKTLIRILIITSFCIGTCYLQSCIDHLGGTGPTCAETVVTTQNIIADDLTKVPYTGFDTLYFLSKTGDTCVVRGTGKQFSSEVENSSGDPACPPEHRYINQIYTINFVSLKGDLAFTLTQKRNPEIIYVDRVSYNVMFDFFSSPIDKPYVYPGYYFDSIKLQSVSYYKVTVFRSVVKFKTQSFDTTYQLLYNKPFGVIRIKSTKHNEEYSLIPKP